MYDTITDVPGVQVGHYTDSVAVTGCTVVLCPEGAVGGVDVRGAAPGTRETDLLRPLNLVQQAHAVVLSGGSAYGLAAADGVMTFLEERGIGFPVGVGVVPIVASAILFDLAIGDSTVRPRPENATRPCASADSSAPAQGSVGAGTGATVGKALGPDRAVKSGLGCASRRVGDYVVGALVAVNALGSIVDADTDAWSPAPETPMASASWTASSCWRTRLLRQRPRPSATPPWPSSPPTPPSPRSRPTSSPRWPTMASPWPYAPPTPCLTATSSRPLHRQSHPRPRCHPLRCRRRAGAEQRHSQRHRRGRRSGGRPLGLRT